jgi:hypothetical protein
MQSFRKMVKLSQLSFELKWLKPSKHLVWKIKGNAKILEILDMTVLFVLYSTPLTFCLLGSFPRSRQ